MARGMAEQRTMLARSRAVELPYARPYAFVRDNLAPTSDHRMDTNLLSLSLGGILAHLAYFGLSIVAVLIFVAIYVMITPHREFSLIRQGNSAAAISLSGAILGYTIALAKAVSQSAGFEEMFLWSGVALVAQLVAYVI